MLRPYSSGDDMQQLLQFLQNCRKIKPHGDFENTGDMLWAMRNPDSDPMDNVCFLIERNAVAGFGMIEGTSLTFRTLPDSAPDNDATLLEWAEDRARLSHPHGPLQTQVREDNVERIHLLEQSGFKRSGNFFTAMERNTDLHGQQPVLPEGFSFMDGPGEEMFDEYVRMHRSAWGPGSTYSVEAHRRVTRLPGYAKELNPTVVTDGGRIAGSCICWPDTVNRIGEIEPLQVEPIYRRIGIARAITLKAVIRMKLFGMERVVVYNSSSNMPAGRAYASSGFNPQGRILVYEKEH